MAYWKHSSRMKISSAQICRIQVGNFRSNHGIWALKSAAPYFVISCGSFPAFNIRPYRPHPLDMTGSRQMNSPNFITKLTYKPNQKNTIQGFGKFSNGRIDGSGAGFGVLPETTTVDTCDESSWNATWISLLTAATTLEGRFGGYWAKCDFLPRNGDVAAPLQHGYRRLVRKCAQYHQTPQISPTG